MRQRLLNQDLYSRLYDDVAAFRILFGLPVEQFETELSEAHEALHQSLLEEEFLEVVKADTAHERMDGLVDTIYVLVGAEVQLGNADIQDITPWRRTLIELCLTMVERLGYQLLPFWSEVQDCNMRKACQTHEEVDATINHYRALGVTTEVREQGGRWVVLCAETCVTTEGKPIKAGKALKNVYWSGPDFYDLL